MSQFVLRFACDITHVNTGRSGKTTLAITVNAATAERAVEIAERNLQAAMLIAQRSLHDQER
jgi:hypothetical protein